MEIYEIILEKLTPLMTEHGFVRHKDAFYRLYNDEMLQAITLDHNRPYILHWGNRPYWCFEVQPDEDEDEPFYGTWWMDGYVKVFEDIPDDDLTEADVEDISPWVDAIEEILAEDICLISTFEQYVDIEVESLRVLRIVQGTMGVINSEMLAYRTYLSGSFDYMKDYIELYRDCLRDAIEKERPRYDPDDIISWFEIYQYRLEHWFEDEERRIAENDLGWIVPVREQMAADMRHKIRTVIGIDLPEK